MSGPANDRVAEGKNTGGSKRYVPAAAVLYGLDALIGSASFGLDPGKLVGTGATGAAADIAAAEPMIRLSMLCEATYQIVEVFLAIQLYRMFRSVSDLLARQMFVLALVPIPIMFVNLLTETGALSVSLDTSWSGAFAPDQRDALAALMIRMHGQGVAVAGIFWGMWLLPSACSSCAAGSCRSCSASSSWPAGWDGCSDPYLRSSCPACSRLERSGLFEDRDGA